MKITLPLLRHCLCIVCLSFVLVNCTKEKASAPPEAVYNSPLTRRIADQTGLISTVYSDTIFQISEGVRETDIFYLSTLGNLTHAFILSVDMNTPGITLSAAMNTHQKKVKKQRIRVFDLQTVPEMATTLDSPGHEIIGGINADFFNVDAPWGIVVKDGNVLKDSWDNDRSQSFFAILDNGEPFIGDTADFTAMKDEITDALGACDRLIAGGVVLYPGDRALEPRTGVGVTKDNVVYFAVVDGRSLHYSGGMTCQQLGQLLKACGATEAVNLDGGGSSTLMIRHPSDASLWQVRNRPSDGAPRAVSDAWMVIADHA